MAETTRPEKNSGNDFQEVPNAHYPFWSRHPFFLNYELAALALGKEPETLRRAALKPEYQLHPVIVEYSFLLKLVDRAQLCGDLPEMISPDKGVEWLDRFELPCSNDFRGLVARYHPAPNWPKFSEEMFTLAFEKARHVTELQAELKRLQEEKTGDIEEFKAWATDALQLIKEQELEIDQLCEKLTESEAEELKAEAADAANDNQEIGALLSLADLDPRAVLSFQKLIVGAAMSSCEYNPFEAGSEKRAARKLEGLLDEAGISLTSKTIEKILKDATVRLHEVGLLRNWK